MGEPSKKKKKSYFKHVIACLPGPNFALNPSRQEWNRIYENGLGEMWKGYTAANIPSRLDAKQFHALLLSMYPPLFM